MTPPAVFTAGVAVGMIIWELAAKLTEARPRRIPYPSTLVRRSPRAQRVVVHFCGSCRDRRTAGIAHGT